MASKTAAGRSEKANSSFQLLISPWSRESRHGCVLPASISSASPVADIRRNDLAGASSAAAQPVDQDTGEIREDQGDGDFGSVESLTYDIDDGISRDKKRDGAGQ